MSINENENEIIHILIEKGMNKRHGPRENIKFTNEKTPDAEKLLNDIETYPHMFVLACIMNRGIKAGKVWEIPYKVSNKLDSAKFPSFANTSLDDIQKTFKDENLHRFHKKMSKIFYEGIQKIHNDYQGDASLIWNDKPKSSDLVRRFLEFEGVSVKIATMTSNILASQFKVPLLDYDCIDISPDSHVKRVFKRVGFVKDENNIWDIIYFARGTYKEYPGIFDQICWDIGEKYCKPTLPKCDECFLKKFCPRIGI